MLRSLFKLVVALLALVALRKIAFEFPHWRPDVLGELPEGRLLKQGEFEVAERLAEKHPVLVNFDESTDVRIQSAFNLGVAMKGTGRRAGQSWAAVGRLGLALESMPVVLVPPGGVVAYQVVLPPKAAFETHVASWFPDSDSARLLRFRLDVISEGSATTVMDESGPSHHPPHSSLLSRGLAAIEKWFARGARPKRWLFKRVETDLSRWSGRSVILRFRVEGEGRDSAGVGLWGAPIVIGERTAPKPNLLFLVIDGLSPQFTDCLEDRPWTDTPVIAELCRSGEVVRRMYTAANGTRASVAALAYGVRASDLLLPIYDREIPDRVRRLRAWGPPSIFEQLAERGYRTAGIHDNIFAVETHEAGYDLGIEESYIVHGTMQDTPNIVHLASNWIRNHRGLPFAMYVHVDVTHDLFKVPPIRDMAATLVHAPSSVFKAFRYASGAHYSDRVAGWLRDLLKEEGLEDDTIFVVLSDHGNIFSRDKKRSYFSKRDGRWQWSDPYGWHGGTTYEDDLRVLWVLNGPGVKPGEREFGWLPEEAGKWARAAGDDLPDPAESFTDSCRPIDMQMGEAWVCPDSLKFVRFAEGIRVKGDGPERRAVDEAWRVSDDFREHVLSGADSEEAFRRNPHPNTHSPRGWVLRIPPSSSIDGRVDWERGGGPSGKKTTAASPSLPVVASDESLGCTIQELTPSGMALRARTQTEWCEFYFESPETRIHLDLSENGQEVKTLSLGPLGVIEKGSRFEFDSSKAPLLTAGKGMPSVFLTEFPVLFITGRRTWAYSNLPTNLSRQTPEVVQIMKDWGYLK
ncbi:MAG: sulfatase-like hydrolase/transferase [Nitrospirae bacterium]|nr:sulfatase-like hydrolase/transferase [Nitrospirota bacterium]